MSIQSVSRQQTVIGLDREIISRLGAFVAGFIFAAVGLVLVGLGAAFPLALTVVEQQGLAVASADLALAQRLAPFWPVFVGAAVAAFAASLSILEQGTIGKRTGIVVAGVGAALAAVVEVALMLRGEPIGVASAIGTAFLVALIASMIVKPRGA